MEKTMDKKDIKRKFSRTASFTIAGLMGLASQAQTSNDSQLDTNQKNKLRIENIKKAPTPHKHPQRRQILWIL